MAKVFKYQVRRGRQLFKPGGGVYKESLELVDPTDPILDTPERCKVAGVWIGDDEAPSEEPPPTVEPETPVEEEG